MTPDLDRTTKDYSEPLIMARRYLRNYEQNMLAHNHYEAKIWLIALKDLLPDLERATHDY